MSSTMTVDQNYELWRQESQKPAAVFGSGAIYVSLFSISENISYRAEIKRMRDEDPAFFKQLITGDTR